MLIINKHRFIIFISFFFITMGEGNFFISIEKNNIFLYLGYAILLLNIYWNFIIKNRKIPRKSLFFRFILVIFLFNIGIYMQPLLDNMIKIRLIFSMIIIASIAMLSEGYIKSFVDIKKASYGILWGITISTIISIFTGTTLVGTAYEGLLGGYGFNGGLDDRNFFAAATIAGFAGIYICNKFEEKTNLDKVMLIYAFILLISSNSRGGYILFLLFLLVINYEKLYIIKKSQRKILVALVCVLTVLGGIYFYNTIALNSGTYMYRVNGLLNLIEYYSNEYFYILFGMSGIAFDDNGQSYMENVRSVLGWDGTTELAILNIFIKNGLFGLLGYIIIFIYFIKRFLEIKVLRYKIPILALVMVLLVSSLSETYMVNINLIFGVFCYIAIAGTCGMEYIHCRKKE